MTAPRVEKAVVILLREEDEIARIPVHFNPVSLQVEITNSTSPQSGSGSSSQTATQTSAKLGLDLLFDTTDTGEDVRTITRRLRAVVRDPDAVGRQAEGGSAAYTPPTVRFDWGTFTFTGLADSFRETLDFFSPEGVPLRGQVAMSLKEQPATFSAQEAGNASAAAAARQRSTAFEMPGGQGGAAGLAAAGGDLRAARAIAGANGESSLRFSTGATLAVAPTVRLQAAVGFSGGDALRRTAPTLRFDAARLAQSAPSLAMPTDAGAAFGVDGRAFAGAAAGLRANVGLRFED